MLRNFSGFASQSKDKNTHITSLESTSTSLREIQHQLLELKKLPDIANNDYSYPIWSNTLKTYSPYLGGGIAILSIVIIGLICYCKIKRKRKAANKSQNIIPIVTPSTHVTVQPERDQCTNIELKEMNTQEATSSVKSPVKNIPKTSMKFDAPMV